MKFEIKDEAWAKHLEAGLSDYIDSLIYEYDNDPETESGLPFCGCDTCYWREVLVYVTPRILQGASEDRLALVSEE